MLKRFLAGFAAVAMLTACSNDEPTGPVTPAQPDGDVAYMAITISAPDAGSRATEDGGYQESTLTALEHTVNNVQFLFFDADGSYVFTANADNTAFDAANDGTHNVEYIGKKCILILNGVRSNNYPEYVVTVLNAPDGFTPGQTMQETADILATYANDFQTSRTAPFVMTTSSFIGEKNGANGKPRHDAKYFATKLNPSDFKTSISEAQDNNTTPVEIYVERLAAKVEVVLAGTTETIDGKDYYKISQTVAGNLNNDENVDGESDAISDVDLYISVLGWQLNATAKQSYMSKKLDWDDNDLWSGWNNPGDWRSFWAKAYTYGPNPDLNYVTPAQVAAGLRFTAQNEGNIGYCYENTNAPANIFNPLADGPLTLNGEKVSVVPSKVTHVVLHTQIYAKDKDGNMYVPSLVQYRGVTFTEQSYIALILNQLKAAGKLSLWHKTGETSEGATYQTVSTADFTIDAKRGSVLGAIQLKMTTEDTLYVSYVDEDGKTQYREATQDDIDAFMEALKAIEAQNPATGSNTAEAFYYIPIEHLAATSTETNAVEGYYGVVRNHWYKLSIQSFKKIGHLVFEPEEDETEIIPDDEEDPMYYVGAKLNILSWKVVNQNVIL